MSSDNRHSVSPRQWSDLYGTFFFAFGLLFAFALYAPVSWTGWLGRALSTVSMGLFGTPAYFLPPVLITFALLYFMQRGKAVKSLRIGALSSLFVLLSAIVSLISMSSATFLQRIGTIEAGFGGIKVIETLWLFGRFPERIQEGNIWSGGLLGGLISNALERVAGITGASIILAAFVISLLVYAFGFSVAHPVQRIRHTSVPSADPAGEAGIPPDTEGRSLFSRISDGFKRLFSRTPSDAETSDSEFSESGRSSGESPEALYPGITGEHAPSHSCGLSGVSEGRSFRHDPPFAQDPAYQPSGAVNRDPGSSLRNGAPAVSSAIMNGMETQPSFRRGPIGWETLNHPTERKEEEALASAPSGAKMQFPQPPADCRMQSPVRLKPIGKTCRPYLFDAPDSISLSVENNAAVNAPFTPHGTEQPQAAAPAAGNLAYRVPEPLIPAARNVSPAGRHENNAIRKSTVSIQGESVTARAGWEDRNDASGVIPLAKLRRERSRHVQMSLLADYKTPPFNLLKEDRGMKKTQEEIREIRELGRKLEDTLASFGIEAKIVNYTTGPTITRFELSPGPGVKVSRIVNLSDDIALSLAAIGVRIEAPIPGKSAIGIEIPNKRTHPVLLRSLLQSKEIRGADGALVAAIGRDVGGEPILCNLAKMPHLLIAGATGSGKSVCINAILISLLYRYSPDHLRLLMIDPKIVELSVYNSIPHLLQPVVTNPEKAYGVLNFAVQEMERRYRMFAEEKVRDIANFNEIMRERLKEAERNGTEDELGGDVQPLPYILIVIDELADLMAVTQHQVEDAISRLMAKARAVGIHVIIATQRPSVDVITGVIKANIPSRIAFAVASQIDSRTIIDSGGAEKLLGKGDMLFYPIGAIKAIRGQGSFVSNSEVERVLSFIKSYYPENYDESVAKAIANPEESSGGNAIGDEEDNLLLDALRIVIESDYASVSLLQRRLQIGYPRAARIIDRLCELEYVGPFEGSKPRKVLVTPEAFDQIMNGSKGES